MSTAANVERYRPSRRQWRNWTRHEPGLAGLDYDRLRRERRHGTDNRKDELLAALVRLAHGNPDAVAVVVACLLPGLRALVARHARGLDRTEALAIAVTALCESVTHHQTDETTFVAGRLLQLPKRRLKRAARVHDAWRQHSRQVPDVGTSGVAQVGLTAAVVLRLGVDAGVLTASDAWLIYATRVAGHELAWAGWRLGVSYETAKKRRQRAETRLAAWWTPPPGTPESAVADGRSAA